MTSRCCQPITVLLPILLLFCCCSLSQGLQLPPRLSAKESEVRVTEGQSGVVLECNLDVGDDPIRYRWFDKDMRWVTGSLGHSYRGYKRLLLALHPIRREHAGKYLCEATNDAGVDTVEIKLIVESRPRQPPAAATPKTNEVLAELAVGLSDVLSESDCQCDVMFLLHASPEAPPDLLSVQANLINTIASSIISQRIRVSIMSYSDYVDVKLPFGEGTNLCALKKALEQLDHKMWSTKLQVVLRDVFKKFKKSSSSCKVMFLPVVGSAGTDGIDLLGAQHLRKMNVTIFLLEVTNDPVPGLADMASKRNDDKPYHWRVPMGIWPSIVTYMQYMTEEMSEGCMREEEDVAGVCLGDGGTCTHNDQCRGAGMGCLQGRCQSLECNVNPTTPGCCSVPGRFWCGDVTRNCTSSVSFCDGRVHCMNGRDEDTCWSHRKPCPPNRVAQCESTTLCLSLFELCDDHYHCPAGEDEDLNFCSRFPCPEERSFKCRNGKCIATDKLCDGKFMDCEAGEDENLKYCSEVHRCSGEKSFKCDYGVCIENSAVCDGIYNCLDGTDEIECSRITCPVDRPFKCTNGECISADVVCNGHYDGCSDGSDEHRCADFDCPAERSFKCDNGRCIDGWLVCNTGDDCGDGTDEQECPEEEKEPIYFPRSSSPPSPTTTPAPPHSSTESPCGSGEFSCSSGACISMSRVCDGRANCEAGDDEENCDRMPCPAARPHRCPGSNACVNAVVCDGVSDCPDASDERDCPTVPSPYPTYGEDITDDEYIYEEYDYDVMLANHGMDENNYDSDYGQNHGSEATNHDHHQPEPKSEPEPESEPESEPKSEPESEPEIEPEVDLVHPDPHAHDNHDNHDNNNRHGYDWSPADQDDGTMMTMLEDDANHPAAASHDRAPVVGNTASTVGSPIYAVVMLPFLTLSTFRAALLQ